MATILIAEDEELIRMMMADVLLDEDFHVLEAGTGEAALQRLRAQSDIDLLIADLGLPDLDGRVLLQRARELNPDLKAVFVTGYGAETMQQPAAGEKSGETEPPRDVLILRKPFDLAELVAAVRTVLRD